MKTMDEMIDFEAAPQAVALCQFLGGPFSAAGTEMTFDFLRLVLAKIGDSPEAIRGAMAVMTEMANTENHMDFEEHMCAAKRWAVWETLISGMPAHFACMPVVLRAREILKSVIKDEEAPDGSR